MSSTSVSIKLALEGAQDVSAKLTHVLQAARAAFSGISDSGKSINTGLSAAEKSVEALTQRIERSNGAFARLRDSGKLTAEQLARLDLARAARVEPLQTQRSALQAQQAELKIASARDTLGVRPFADIDADIAKARAAFTALKESGTLSVTAIAQAKLKLQERIAELQSQTNGFAQSFLKVKESLAAAAGSFLVFRAASSEAIAFESAMADVRKVVDATPEGIERIGQSIRQLSTEIPIAAVGLAQMAEAGGQLGIEGEKIPEFVRLASEMSVAFKISAEESGNAVGKLGNIFSLSIPQVRGLADSINALGDSSAATERDIVNVLQRTGGLGRQFGLSAQETAALASAFLSLGDPPEIAATAINNLLSKLQAAPAQSAEFQRVLKVLGFDAKKLARDIDKDAVGSLRGFLAALDKLDAKSRSQSLSMLFGTGGDTASIAKLVNDLGKLDTALQTATSQAAEGGLGRALQIQLDTARSQLDLAGNGLRNIGNALGAALLPLIKGAAVVVQQLAKLVTAAVEAAPTLSALGAGAAAVALSLGALKVVAATLGLFFAKFGVSATGLAGGLLKLLPAGGAAATGLSAVGVALRGMLGPIGLVATAVLGLLGLMDALEARRKRQTEGASTDDLQAERKRLQAQAELEASIPFSGEAAPDRTASDRIATIDAELERRRQAERSTPGKPGKKDGRDITAALDPDNGAARRAGLEAERAAAEASARLAADARQRELAALRLGLERETVALDDFYAQKLAAAQADADEQLALKRQAIADEAALRPVDAQGQAAQRGRLAQLRAEREIMERQREQLPAENQRERDAERLRVFEETERSVLAIQLRGIEEGLIATRQGHAQGRVLAAELATEEEQAALRRADAEVEAAERILQARLAAEAPASAIRGAEAELEDARLRRAAALAVPLEEAGRLTRQLREDAAEIRLDMDGEPARREIEQTRRQVLDLQGVADALKARLIVRLDAEVDPFERERIQEQIGEIDRAAQEATVALNDRLAERMKPGWQRMVDGWRDTQRLMREALDTTMSGLLASAEDAFVRFAQTGKLSVKGMVDSILAELARLQFRKAVADSGGLLSTIASVIGARIGLSPGADSFVGPLRADGSRAAGGPVAAGGLYQVNELGTPELLTVGARQYLMMAGQGGTVSPARLGASAAAAAPGAAGGGVQVIVHNAAPGAQATAREERGADGQRIVTVLVEQVQAALAGDIARGAGPVAGALQRTYGLNRAAGAY